MSKPHPASYKIGKAEKRDHFAGECRHLFSRRAKDLAGNYEEVQQVEFGIDSYSPVVTHSVWAEPGITVVYLKAEDSSSGIKQLIYYVDGILNENYVDPIVLTEPGEHRINYIAIDNAGRSSALETVTVEVKEFSQGEWVENLKFTYFMPGRELVRNVQVGEQLYGPARDSHGKNRCDDGMGFGGHNKIKALPDYLAGADFIRTHFADKNFWGKAFITFSAKAGIDVFIMKHEKSHANLSGWTLVEEDFPVEPVVYFRGGADIYTRSYRQGETVTIPGSCIYFNGWENLVFVQYAKGNYIKIINPEAGVELEPYAVQRYGAAVLGLKYDSITWHRRVGDGEWEELGTGLSGEMQVPFVEKTTAMELRVSLYDETGGFVADRIAGYVIRNEFGIMLLNPGPGTEVLTGEEVTLVYTAKDAEGKALAGEKVVWAYSTDKVNWKGITGNKFTAPAVPGKVYLRGEAEAVPGVVQQVVFFVDVTEVYGTTAITFGKADGENYTLGKQGTCMRPENTTGLM